MLFGLKKDSELVVIVVTLLSYGCPIPAIVAAFGLDVRTVRSWLQKAGQHCQGVHGHFIKQRALDLGHVQADEIKVKTQSGWIWMAMAMMVSTRLWLGGAVSAKRNLALITELVAQIRSIALCRKLLLSVDGLRSYVKAFQRAFRTPLHTGKTGTTKADFLAGNCHRAGCETKDCRTILNPTPNYPGLSGHGRSSAAIQPRWWCHQYSFH